MSLTLTARLLFLNKKISIKSTGYNNLTSKELKVEPTYRLLKTSRISLLLEEGRGDLGVSEVTELLSSRSAWLELC